jgi:DNA topoisomerase-6 subunit B
LPSSSRRTGHLLGFDSPLKALLTAVKEAVDNSLDACEEAGILPRSRSRSLPRRGQGRRRPLPHVRRGQRSRHRPRADREVFGKLLYGSKFHKLSQSRGQQGIGISAAGMYGLLTTGKPVRIVSRTGKKAKAHEFQLSIDTGAQQPDVHDEREIEWDKDHGTRVEIEMEAKYQKGLRSVDMYLKLTAIANPHVTIRYTDPGGEKVVYERSTKTLPAAVEEIKPHPHGVELGALIAMLKDTKARSLSGFLQEEFSRVGRRPRSTSARSRSSRKGLPVAHRARGGRRRSTPSIQQTKISAPSTACISPIGDQLVLSGLKKESRPTTTCRDAPRRRSTAGTRSRSRSGSPTASPAASGSR